MFLPKQGKLCIISFWGIKNYPAFDLNLKKIYFEIPQFEQVVVIEEMPIVSKILYKNRVGWVYNIMLKIIEEKESDAL